MGTQKQFKDVRIGEYLKLTHLPGKQHIYAEVRGIVFKRGRTRKDGKIQGWYVDKVGKLTPGNILLNPEIVVNVLSESEVEEMFPNPARQTPRIVRKKIRGGK